ncbi:20442_t:CDS:1 [Dentiscutata erythropus]|uniref:20442_t:CDS:1 n=1 Tax=Dentiscutata erythropus TaxID=1348616 RepID=A0A9N9FAD4_9GLOM|nr:20442_t:CDS:1 [Dentiscutata erythropus]
MWDGEDKDKLSEEESNKIIESISRLNDNVDKDRVDIVNYIQVGSTLLLLVIVDKCTAQLIVYKEKEPPDVNVVIEADNISESQVEKLAQTIGKELFSLFSDQLRLQKHRYNAVDYLLEVKECNQLLEKINEMLNNKSELQAKLIKMLESQIKEDTKAIEEIKRIRDELEKTEKELEDTKEDLKSKLKKIEEMEKQMKEIKQEGTENPDIKKQLEAIQVDLNNSYDKLVKYEVNLNDTVLQKVKPPVMIVNKTLNKYTMHTLSLGTAINYVGGVVSTSGYGVIGGGITLGGSFVDTITSKIEELDEKGHEALIALEETCQKLRTLVEQKSLNVKHLKFSDFSEFSELVNKLQNNIIKGAKEAKGAKEVELDKINQIKELKKKTEVIDEKLKALIKTQQEQSTETSSSESSQELEDNNRFGLDDNRFGLDTRTSYSSLLDLIPNPFNS